MTRFSPIQYMKSGFAKRMTQNKTVFLVLSSVLVAFGGGALSGWTHLAYSNVPCFGYRDGVPTPDGYGAAYNVLTTARELLVSVTCDKTSATVTVGSGAENQLIYRYGYAWRNNAWQRITLSSTNPLQGNAWYARSANATLSRTVAEMAQESNYVVGYVCQWVTPTGGTGTWKCGCRDGACQNSYWQLQYFSKALADLNTLPDVLTDSNDLLLAYGAPKYGPPGSTISLTGSGFTGANTITFGSRTISNVPAVNQGLIRFTVPADMPLGRVEIGVRNSKGIAEHATSFMVSKPGAVPPVLQSIAPARGMHGTEVTIHGTGFTPTGNDAITTFGPVRNIPSKDGTTLTLTLRPFPDTPSWQDGSSPAHGQSYPMYIYISNTNGVSDQPVTFTVDI